MKRTIPFSLLLIFIFILSACNHYNPVLDKINTYEVETNIKELKIHINAADFTIEHSDNIFIQSNLKYLTIKEENEVLIIEDETKPTANYNDAVLKLYIPTNLIFKLVDIKTGAARLTIPSISTNNMNLKLGAGEVLINNINVYEKLDIEGGTGKIKISNGILHNLSLSMGVGELNLTAEVKGDCNFEFGVGESNLTILGKKENYKLDITKGLGVIKVDGKTVTDFGTSGNGENEINVEGGVGSVNIEFKEEKVL